MTVSMACPEFYPQCAAAAAAAMTIERHCTEVRAGCVVFVSSRSATKSGEGEAWSNWEGVKTSGVSVMCRLMPPGPRHQGQKHTNIWGFQHAPQLMYHPTHLKHATCQ